MKSKKVHKRSKPRTKLFSLEPLFIGAKQALTHDLANGTIFAGYPTGRETRKPSYDGLDPYQFKRITQIANFDKRIIWSSDRSFEELGKDALRTFSESQTRFLLPEPVSLRAELVLQKACELCTEILGTFSYDTWFDSCLFGKKAALGLTRRAAYLDNRIARLSGTPAQVAAFNACLSRDVHLLRAVREKCRVRTTVQEIKVTTVPKSYKSARCIAPDTILGGFLSRGLGDYVRKRLERNTHINLAKQQERHRRWAQSASVSGHLATIDMSKASDSFTWRHIERLVPEDWHAALKCVRVPRCNVLDESLELTSYMLMGSGHTFPLQTLLFYSLAEATRRLLKIGGKVSVYGDDIIVPVKTSHHFIVIMEELGFQINSEKSFFDVTDPLNPSKTFFRESCGGDYKGGVDVRPYMPECDLQSSRTVPRNEVVAWCHKMINGLLERWEFCEIETTLRYLLGQISSLAKEVCFVPAFETDHAGIKHYLPDYLLIGLPVRKVTYTQSIPTYFSLKFSRPKRKRSRKERIYYWYCLSLKKNRDPGDGGEIYSSTVDLAGEERKDLSGAYRWKVTGPS